MPCRCAQVATQPGVAFYRALGLILSQYDGLRAGYAAAVASSAALPALSNFDFQMLNGVGDLFDVIPTVYPSLRRDFGSMTGNELQRFMFTTGRCSALIKVLGDFR